MLPRFELMSSSRTSTEMISRVQFTYSSVFHFLLVGAPLFFHRFSSVFSDVLSLVRKVPQLVSAHQGQQRRPKGVGVKVERLKKCNLIWRLNESNLRFPLYKWRQ
jgi:hypothetical protein